jgi:ferredoxin
VSGVHQPTTIADMPTSRSQRLRVNPITCDAHGMCAELLPELITLDEFGYPIVPDELLPPDLGPLAQRAVQACPARALLLEALRRH